MKCLTKFVIMTSVTGLIPFWMMSSAAQTANNPIAYSTKTSASFEVLQMSSSGTTTDLISKPQTGFSDTSQPKVHKTMPTESFHLSQPLFSAITLGDKTTATPPRPRLKT